ncbi:MAG: hypothetical protein EAY75_01425 [Bacteroidetes bacterium]|nr:MAG: hypothetical protein EAY75_01425 [Bacteroidota bacterium]
MLVLNAFKSYFYAYTKITCLPQKAQKAIKNGCGTIARAKEQPPRLLPTTYTQESVLAAQVF